MIIALNCYQGMLIVANPDVLGAAVPKSSLVPLGFSTPECE